MTPPPVSIWPPAAVRFARRDFRRIDATSHFIVRKRHVAALAIGTGLGLPLASCATHFASTQDDGTGFFFVGILIILVSLIIIISKKSGKGGGGCSAGGGCGGDSGGSGCGGGGCGGGGD